MQSKDFLQQTFVSAVITGLLYYLGIVAVPIIILIVAVFFAVLVAVWLIINELISVLENLSRIGVPIPNFLKKIINKLKMTIGLIWRNWHEK